MAHSARYHWLLLGLSVLGLLVHYGWFFYGHFGFDDLHYARLSQSLFTDGLDWSDHYSYRVLPIFLIGLSRQLFGANDFAAALPALLATVSVLWLLLLHFRNGHWGYYLLAIALFFSLRWNLFYADKMMPDVFVSAFAFWAWTAYVRRWYAPVLRGALVALALFLAFNAKGTIILLVPLFAGYCLYDLYRGRRAVWLSAAATTVLLLGAYALLSRVALGNPLARFAAIDANHYLNDCSYDQLGGGVLLDRLTSGFYRLLVDTRLWVHGAGALAAGILMRRLAPGQPGERSAYFYVATVVVGLLSVNFMSISLTSYNPVCLDARHILLFSPLFTVCTVTLLRRVVPAHWLEERYRFLSLAVLLLLSGWLLWPALSFAKYARTLEYPAVRADFRTLLRTLPEGATLYGSEVFRNYGDYFTNYGSDTAGLTFRNVDELPNCPPGPAAPAFVASNWYADWHAGLESATVDTLVANRNLRLEATELGNARFGVREIVCPAPPPE